MTDKNKEVKLEKKTKILGITLAKLGIFFILQPLLYYGIIASRHGGTWNYKKWSEFDKQKEIQTQNSYRNQFQELDKNNNYVLDSTEFIYRE